MAVSNKAKKRLALFLVITIALLAIIFAWNRLTPRERYSNGFSQIHNGDAKQKVLKLFGQPDEISDCYSFLHSQADDETKARCVEQYWYRGGLEQWIIVFDKNENVISKSHNVMY